MAHSPAAQTLHVVSYAGSIRTGSINNAVLDFALKDIEAAGDTLIDRIDLASYPLPLYNADDQNAYGIPDAVWRLKERIDPAHAVLIASPEYNGGYTPLFKNTLDWLTRTDKTLFQGSNIGLITASGGRMGGANGARQMAELFGHMHVHVHDPTLSIPHAPDHLETGEIPGLESWVADYLTASRSFLDAATST